MESLPKESQLPMALTERRYIFSRPVGLRRERRYRCNWFVRFIVAPVSTTQKEAPIGRIRFEPNSENAFSSAASCCSPRPSAALPLCCRPSCRSPGMALQPTAASCCSSACMQSTRLSRTAVRRSGTSMKRTITLPRPEAASRSIPMEPLNKSAAALSGSFAPTYRFENLEILRSRWRLCRLTDAACPLRVHKVFLQFPNLNLEQNPSLTALAI